MRYASAHFGDATTLELGAWADVIAVDGDLSRHSNPECMVRRRTASEKWEWRVGLRECIRPLLE
jgi:hypothetical protein